MSEPWDETTQYGRVDLTLDPLVREAYKVACLIERCGASPDLTAASSAAFELCEKTFDRLFSLASYGIDADAALAVVAHLDKRLGPGWTERLARNLGWSPVSESDASPG